MYYYLYKITNNINHHYYYGVHATDNMDDNYMGSGQALWKAYSKYGIENFTKEILEYFQDSQSMFDREAQIVTQELVEDHNCYNLCLGGSGYQKGHVVKEDTRQSISKSRTGIKFTEDHIRHIIESGTTFQKGHKPWNTGKHISEETKKKISQKLKGKVYGKHESPSEETKKKISQTLKSKNKDEIFTEEVRRKISDGVKRSKKRT